MTAAHRNLAFALLGMALSSQSALSASLDWDNNFGSSGPQGGTGTWNTTATNWWNGIQNVRFVTGNDVAFGGTPGVVTLGATLTAGAMTFLTSGYVFQVGSGLTLTADAGINGNYSFSKNGAGSLVVNGLGNFASTLALNAGTLQLNSASGLGTGLIRFGANNPRLDLRRDADTSFRNSVEVDYSGTISADRSTSAGGTGKLLAIEDLRVQDGATLSVDNGHGFRLGARNVALVGAATVSLAGASGLFVSGSFTDSSAATILLGATSATNRALQGLQFVGGVPVTLNAGIVATDKGGSSLGASGPGTQVTYLGSLDADTHSAQIFVTVTDSGQFTFGAGAVVDTSRPGKNDRPFCIVGDGTGSVVFAPGFISNPSARVGIDSVQVGNATWVTHDSANLGMALVAFDAADGARWQTKGSAQTFSGEVIVSRNASLETLANLTLQGTLTGNNATRTLTKLGSGTLTLAGSSANTFSGGVSVAAGTLRLEKNGALGSISSLQLAPGTTLELAGGSGVTDRLRNTIALSLNDVTLRADGSRETLGALQVGVDGAMIDLTGTGSSQLTFGNSLGQLWDGPLTINGWSNGSDGRGADHVIFTGGLTVDQLSLIAFQNPNGSGLTVPADLLPSGEIIAPTHAPEPTTNALLALAAGGLLLHRLRGRKRTP